MTDVEREEWVRTAYAVAYHEAGHAVAHLALKRGMVKLVTILPDGRTAGRFEEKERRCVELFGRRPTLKNVKADIVADLAGRAAELLAAGLYEFEPTPDMGAIDDIEHANGLADFMIEYLNVDASKDAIIERGVIRASRLVARYWAHIDAVARELVVRHTLTGKELREVFDSVNTAPTGSRRPRGRAARAV